MNGNDKLSDRLKRLRVPVSPNPAHEAALRKELERLAAEPAPVRPSAADRRPLPADPARGRVTRGVFARPALPVMGAAAAAAVVIGIFILLKSPAGTEADVASGAAPAGVVVMQSGELGLDRSGLMTALQPGDSLRPLDRVAPAAGGWGVLRIDETVFVKLEPGASFRWRSADEDEGRPRLVFDLERGSAYFVTRRFPGVLTVAAARAEFEALGTSFKVGVDRDRATLAVIDGAVRVFQAGPDRAVLREAVPKDETLALTDGGTAIDSSATVTDADRRESARLLSVAAGPPAARSGESVRLTVEARPADAVIVLQDGWPATGRLSFLAERGRQYGVTVTAAGYEAHSALLEADESQTLSIVLEKEKPPTLTPAPAPRTAPSDVPPESWERRQALPVPRAAIVLSGAVADWRGLAPVIVDPAGDANLADPGADLSALYLARDDRTLWIGIGFANGLPAASLKPEAVLTLLADTGDRLVVTAAAANGGYRARAAIIAAGEEESVPAGEAAVKAGGSFLETGLPLSTAAGFFTPGRKCEISLSVSLQKYGRLRVVSDKTDTVLVAF